MTDPNEKQLTPVKAIRAYCLECCCESVTEVKLCPAAECHLWPYRMGKNPARKGRVLTEEEKRLNYERLMKFKLSKSVDNSTISKMDADRSTIPQLGSEYPVFGNFPDISVWCPLKQTRSTRP